MCGGGGGAEAAARQSAANEEARQQRIRTGMSQLNAMFGGGTYGTGQLAGGAVLDPNATYYDLAGNPVRGQSFVDSARQKVFAANPTLARIPDNPVPHLMSSENDTYSPDIYAEQRTQRDSMVAGAQEEAWKNALAQGLFSGTASSGGYGGVYDKAYQAQLDYALPEVDRQFADAQRQLQFGLARQGLSASTQGAELGANLERQRDLAIQGEQEKARQARATQMANVEGERDNLARMLQSSGDLDAVMNMASSRRAMLGATPQLQEVGPLFQNTTSALADMFVSPALRQQQTGPKGYGTNKGSGKVVN